MTSSGTNGSSVMYPLRPEHLLRLARDRSARGREELSEAVSDLFVTESEALSDKERALMQAILHHLIRDAESSVRRLMSEKLANIPTVPRDLIKMLANDEIEIAGPILKKSTVLQDVDLIEVIRNRTMEHQLAIAVREHVSEQVSGALVVAGHESVITTLLSNDNAQISLATLEYVVEQSRRVDSFRDPVLLRSELDPELARKVTCWVSAALREYILDEFDIPASTVDDILETAAITEAHAVSEEARQKTRAKELATELAKSGDITPELLVRVLKAGEIALFVALFERISGLRENLIRRFIHEPGGEGLAIACKALEMCKEDFKTLFVLTRKSRNTNDKTLKREKRNALSLYGRMTVSAAEDVVLRWRRDVNYLRAIRDLEVGV